MIKSILTYGILILLGGTLLYHLLPIGDYCEGLIGFFNMLFFGRLLLLAFVVVTVFDLIRLWRKKRRFDFVPLAIILVVGLLCYVHQGLKNKKFWTEKTLTGGTEIQSTPRSGYLHLYKNGTFGATFNSADYSCTFQGEYEPNGKSLTLKRPELTELTEGTFTTEYLIDLEQKTITPADKNFGVLSIVE